MLAKTVTSANRQRGVILRAVPKVAHSATSMMATSLIPNTFALGTTAQSIDC
jgi:hypothetical protein